MNTPQIEETPNETTPNIIPNDQENLLEYADIKEKKQEKVARTFQELENEDAPLETFCSVFEPLLEKLHEWQPFAKLGYLQPSFVEVLARQGGHLDLSGLETLDVPTAEVLASHTGIVALNGVKALEGEAGAALLQRNTPIQLGGLEKVDQAAGHLLSKHPSLYFLPEPLKEELANSDSNLSSDQHLQFQDRIQTAGKAGLPSILEALSNAGASRADWYQLFSSRQIEAYLEEPWTPPAELATPLPPSLSARSKARWRQSQENLLFHRPQLDLSVLGHLPKYFAECIAFCPATGPVNFNGLLTIDEQALLALSLMPYKSAHEPFSRLKLGGLKELDEASAKVMGTMKAIIHFEKPLPRMGKTARGCLLQSQVLPANVREWFEYIG